MIRVRIFTSIFCLFLSANAFASLFQLYGYGARSMGLGNATGALPADALSFQYNPSLIAWQTKPIFSAGVMTAFENFEKINSVVVDTPSTGADTSAPDAGYPVNNVSTDVPNPLIFLGALSTPISKGERPLHLGLSVSTPLDKVIGAETQDPFVPQYALYQSDTQRLNISFGLAKLITENWSLGLGANVYLTQGVTTRFRLPASGGRQSTGIFKADVKPGLSLMVGTSVIVSPEWTLGFAWQQKNDVKTEIYSQNDISLLSPSTIFLKTSASLYYDPEIVELSANWHPSSQQTYLLSARYEKWSEFTGSYLKMTFDSFTGSFQQNLPDSHFKDVVSARAGFENDFGSWVGRLGYEFKPSPAPSQDDRLNYLDSTKHVVQLGAGVNKWDLKIDGATFFQYLVPKDIRKANAQTVGSPGYKIGGWVLGLAVTVTSEL